MSVSHTYHTVICEDDLYKKAVFQCVETSTVTSCVVNFLGVCVWKKYTFPVCKFFMSAWDHWLWSDLLFCLSDSLPVLFPASCLFASVSFNPLPSTLLPPYPQPQLSSSSWLPGIMSWRVIGTISLFPIKKYYFYYWHSQIYKSNVTMSFGQTSSQGVVRILKP